MRLELLHAGRKTVAVAILVLGMSLHPAATRAGERPIRIGEINTYSGIAAGFTLPYRQAIEMALDEVNAAGGLLGQFCLDLGEPWPAAEDLLQAFLKVFPHLWRDLQVSTGDVKLHGFTPPWPG